MTSMITNNSFELRFLLMPRRRRIPILVIVIDRSFSLFNQFLSQIVDSLWKTFTKTIPLNQRLLTTQHSFQTRTLQALTPFSTDAQLHSRVPLSPYTIRYFKHLCKNTRLILRVLVKKTSSMPACSWSALRITTSRRRMVVCPISGLILDTSLVIWHGNRTSLLSAVNGSPVDTSRSHVVCSRILTYYRLPSSLSSKMMLGLVTPILLHRRNTTTYSCPPLLR